MRAGEILGLAGLVGAGRTELARVLFGLTPADSGSIVLKGKTVTVDSPARAVELGIAYVPEDRRRHGVILEMPVAANCTLAILRDISRRGILDFSRERQIAAGYVERFGIKTPSLDAPAGNLSGGNQQKVSLARWLATEPAVIILDEPTQGVDVGAKAEIHRLMGELVWRGLAIIMISSELPEVLGMSDRVAVMHGGKITGVLNRADATQEMILELALGHQLSQARPCHLILDVGNRHLRMNTLRKRWWHERYSPRIPCPPYRGPARFSFAISPRDFRWRWRGMLFTDSARRISPGIFRHRMQTARAIATPADLGQRSAHARAGGWNDARHTGPAYRHFHRLAIFRLRHRRRLAGGEACAHAARGAGNTGRRGVHGSRQRRSLSPGLGMPSIVVTLATLVIIRGALSWATQGATVLLPASFQWFGLSQVAGQALMIVVALGVFGFFGWMLRWMSAGRAVYAVGSDQEAARLAGIRPPRVVFNVFVLMGLLTAIAAMLNAMQFITIYPSAGRDMELAVIAAVVIGGTAITGGRGTIVGTLLAVMLLATIAPGAGHFHAQSKYLGPWWAKAIQGSIILLAVATDGLQRRRN